MHRPTYFYIKYMEYLQTTFLYFSWCAFSNRWCCITWSCIQSHTFFASTLSRRSSLMYVCYQTIQLLLVVSSKIHPSTYFSIANFLFLHCCLSLKVLSITLVKCRILSWCRFFTPLIILRSLLLQEAVFVDQLEKHIFKASTPFHPPFFICFHSIASVWNRMA